MWITLLWVFLRKLSENLKSNTRLYIDTSVISNENFQRGIKQKPELDTNGMHCSDGVRSTGKSSSILRSSTRTYTNTKALLGMRKAIMQPTPAISFRLKRSGSWVCLTLF